MILMMEKLGGYQFFFVYYDNICSMQCILVLCTEILVWFGWFANIGLPKPRFLLKLAFQRV